VYLRKKTYGDTRTEFTYPVIKDLIDKRIEEKVNNTLKARIEDYRNLIAATEDLAVEETMTVWYEVPFRSKEVLSIKFYIKSYLKAEDYTDITIDTFNFDLRTGEDIPIADLFTIKTYKDKLNAILQVKFNELDVETNKEFAGIDEDQDYYFKDDKLVIFFQSLVYQVFAENIDSSQVKTYHECLYDVSKDWEEVWVHYKVEKMCQCKNG